MTLNSKSTFQPGNLAVVIGGTGFIGSHLVRFLRNSGFRVRVYARRSFADCPAHLTAGIEPSDWFTGDACDAKSLALACTGAKTVFYTSGVSRLSSSNVDEMERVNVGGAHALVEVCAEACIPRLVYVSSALAAGPATSAYARSKRHAERILLEASNLQLAGVHISVLRPTNVYGPGMRGNIATMIKLIASRRLPPLPNLNNHLTLISVSDVCRAALLAATHSHDSGQIFTLIDGERYTPSLIESAIYNVLQRKSPRWKCPRVLFFVACLGAEILNQFGIWRNDLGLRTYRNLVKDNPQRTLASVKQLGFAPSQTLYTVLPEITGLDA